MLTVCLSLLCIIVSVVGILILRSHRRYQNYWRKKGFTPYIKSVPFFGNFYSMTFKKLSISEYITKVYNHFPEAKYTGILQFNIPTLVLRDPELIKDVCIKNFDNFTDHRSFVPEDADPLFGRMVFFLKGTKWREMRQTLTPSFTGSKMKLMFELISKCSRDFVQYFLDHPEEANSVEMKDTFTRYATDVIATTAFGITVNSLKDRNNEFYLRGKEAVDFNSIKRLLKIIALGTFTKFMKFIGEPIMSRSTTRFFRTIIEETIKIRKEKNIVRPDMIHLLMTANDNEKGVKVSIEDIAAQGLIFFLAGFSTSATAMGFVIHELAVNPEIQEKLREEIDHLTEQEGEISYDTLFKMKYLDMIISETLRKYPPNGMMDRVCVKSFTLPKSTPDSKEFETDLETVIWLPIYALHHDPQYFPDPEKFDPERFNDENKDKINPYAYIPFGIGPRKCIGDRFALMEIKILIVHLLQNFVLEREERTKHPIEFEKSFLIIPNGDMWVKFKKRNNNAK
ncbi:cytochrome P450 9e2-like [Leptopilina boulardi]|uniref:cytochrome P450 9e2-like n=1 Tax=Leptopilina boulardi TaxID=63433 RepID=UPI0021F65899|nr:cytochrome P450 9e2-like [Leptopilina boulardi]